MTDPVANAFALQTEYGDEELQRAMEERIAAIVKQELVKLFNDPSFAQRFISNNAYMFDQIARQAFKTAVASINTY